MASDAPAPAPGRFAMPAAVTALIDRVDRDDTARRAMWLVWAIGFVVLIWVGHDQWFLRDDWAFLFTRDRYRESGGVELMLMYPQDGHWMLWPIATFHLLRSIFGIDSYLPYLLVLFATHIGVVVLSRAWMRRLGVSAWVTTLMTGVLLMFGAGWENLLFAVQIVYNFSLLAFLAQTLLVDHDGPVDRRDYIGSGISLIGVSSSGFGPFFGFGVAVLLVLRRRWTAAAIAVIPQAIAWSWWWLKWGDDPAGDAGNAGPRFVVSFVKFGFWSTFGSLNGSGIFAWSAVLLTAAMIIWPRTSAAQRAPMIAMVATAVAMYAGIGVRREAFGPFAAAWPRYQYVAAMLVAPGLALGLDQARRFTPWAKWLPRVLLVFAMSRNAMWLRNGGEYWAGTAEFDRHVFSLVAGSDERFTLPPDGWVSEVSPDVQVGNLDAMVDAGAITREQPETPEDEALLAQALDAARLTGVLPPP